MNEASSPVNDLWDTVLDAAALANLFRDLELAAHVSYVRAKGGEERYSLSATPTLGEARAWLDAGHVIGVQVGYEFRGAHWIDTLMRVPSGVRLVRTRRP